MLGPTGELAAADTSIPYPHQTQREISSGVHSGLGRGGGRECGHRLREGLLAHKWLPQGQMCSVTTAAPVAPGWGGGGVHPTPNTARRAARRRGRVLPSRTSLLPCGTASTEPGRPLAFHYWAYESSSPGKYVAIKINRPALSAEHNANYLWAVCAVFIIGRCASRPPRPPGRRGATLQAGCGGAAGGSGHPSGVPRARPTASL